MIAVGCTALNLCTQPMAAKVVTTQEKSEQPNKVGEKIDCLTLDGVLLHTFESLADIRAELGLQVILINMMI
jgi:hypothetical protein